VRDVQRSDAEVLLQGFDLVPDLFPDAGIEIGQRLVQQQDSGADRQCTASATRWRRPPESAVTLRSPSPSNRSMFNSSATRFATTIRLSWRNFNP
jgi:hypothetical protein